MAITKKKLETFKREQARALGLQAWANRYSQRCPYEPGSELAEIWHDARSEARRRHERPEIQVDTPSEMALVIERLNRHFRGES